jgi:hypothetical protein
MMKNNRNTIAGIILLFCSISNMLIAQEALLSLGGTSADGSVSYSFGLLAYSSYFDGSSSLAEGVQHPWETFDQGSVPINFSLLNTTINHSTCYNALQNITVAGDGMPVTLQSNAIVEFIAGQSIRFLPGFHAQSGSYVHAHITTTGTFCNPDPAPSIVQAPPPIEKSIEFKTLNEALQTASGEKQIKLYPNPNNGRFTLQLQNFDSRTEVLVVNLLGKTMHKTSIFNIEHIEIDMLNAPRGIYHVIVNDGRKIETAKMIVY